jgi:hypothetical protein
VTVEQSDVIDGIGTDKVTGSSVLTISDHLGWDRPLDYHRDCLERKLGAYIQFIESGRIRELHPEPKSPTVQIFLLRRPSEEGQKMLAAARAALGARGFPLIYGPLPDGYAEDN